MNDLNPQQLEAVTHYEGPALIIAGPGSGKTKVLTHRVAYLITKKGVAPENILLLTFTNKAATEMTARAENLIGTRTKLPWSGTFHSVCSRILRRDGHHIGINPGFTIYDEDDAKTLIKKIIKDLDLSGKKISEGAVKGSISSAKNELLTPDDYSVYARGYFQELVAKIYHIYQKELAKCQALDFDDLINHTTTLFKETPAVLEKYLEQFKYVLVDEYQDTNHAQYVLTRLLAGPQKNLCVVGDMAQAIYSFRGADSRNLLNFQKDFPTAAVYKLSQNYRSTPQIISAAAELIKNNRQQLNLDLWTGNPSGDPVTVYLALNEKDEAEFVVSHVHPVIPAQAGIQSLNDIAILYRTNAQSRSLEEAFLQNNIPYRIVGGINFYERKEIKDVVAYLRLVQNPLDRVSTERILKIGKTKAAAFNLLLQRQKDINSATPLEVLEAVLEATQYLDLYKKEDEENLERIENVKELRTVAGAYASLPEFLESITLLEKLDKKSSQAKEAVTMMTLHSAKGLEYKTVFLVGLEEGLFPHQRSIGNQDELEEERRLAYVGITRAKEQLYLTHTQSRYYFGSHQTNLPSRFLDEIPEHLVIRLQNSFSAGPGLHKAIDKFLDDLEQDRNGDCW